MAVIKKYSPKENLARYQTFILDTKPNSEYFKITELGENFTGGKNGFLIQGSECLKESSDIRIEILDVDGNPIYFEPGKGTPQYYEGLSALISVVVYNDTPIGIGKITILGELKSYYDGNGNKVDIPEEWKGIFNVKWEREININRTLPNTSRVRFSKKPKIEITELSRPIFNKTFEEFTQTGSVEGRPEEPPEGTRIDNYGGEIRYRLVKLSGDDFQQEFVGKTVEIPSLDYSATILEVQSNEAMIVDTAYTSSEEDFRDQVVSFASASYTSSFSETTTTATTLTGSLVEVNITDLKTFVGDVARLKVFRKSRSETGDFQLLQEVRLEAVELLRDINSENDTEVLYGQFTDDVVTDYWVTSSNSVVSINSDFLLNGLKVDYSGAGTQLIYTSESLSIEKDTEYSIQFSSLLSGSVDNTKRIKAYLSSSEFTQSLGEVSGSTDVLQKFDYSSSTLSLYSGSAQLVFEVNGDDWYISDVSFKHSEESSFSPDEFSFVIDNTRKLARETFDFKFEFYDINNNFIPLTINEEKEFTGGDVTRFGGSYIEPYNVTARPTLNVDLGNSDYDDVSMFKLSWTGGSGLATWTLPDATLPNSVNRRIRFISDSSYSTNTRIDLAPSGSQNLDGANSAYQINKAFEGIQVWSDGTEWFIIQKKA